MRQYISLDSRFTLYYAQGIYKNTPLLYINVLLNEMWQSLKKIYEEISSLLQNSVFSIVFAVVFVIYLCCLVSFPASNPLTLQWHELWTFLLYFQLHAANQKKKKYQHMKFSKTTKYIYAYGWIWYICVINMPSLPHIKAFDVPVYYFQ